MSWKYADAFDRLGADTGLFHVDAWSKVFRHESISLICSSESTGSRVRDSRFAGSLLAR